MQGHGETKGKWVKKEGHWQYESPELGTFLGDFSRLERPAAETGDFWGEWVYDAEDGTLTHKKHNYEVRLDEFEDATQFVDWIAQLHEKTWLSSKGLGHFIDAIDDLIGLRHIQRRPEPKKPAKKAKH